MITEQDVDMIYREYLYEWEPKYRMGRTTAKFQMIINLYDEMKGKIRRKLSFQKPDIETIKLQSTAEQSIKIPVIT